MKVEELVESAKSKLTSGTVFGEPYEKGDLTVIPVARVSGGAGGGSGQQEGEPGGQGEGGGFGISARPAGAYVIRDGKLSWQPAVDANKVIAALAAVAIAFIVSRALVRIRCQ